MSNERHGVLESSKIFLKEATKHQPYPYLIMLRTNIWIECRYNREGYLFDYLQQALDEIPWKEAYVVLGDSNVGVGKRVSHPKTKLMAVGRKLINEDRIPLIIGDEEIASVNDFPYLGS